MRWKEIARDYLTFSRKESIAVVVLLVVLSIIIISPTFFKAKKKKNTNPPDKSWMVAVKQLEQTNKSLKDSAQTSDVRGYEYDRRESHQFSSNSLFFFDPNRISTDDWKKLGLRDKTIRTIQNYLSKGGQFKRKEDLQRIYGLRQNEYDRLEPFIQISIETAEKINEVAGKSSPPVITRPFVKTDYSPIDVNTADTSEFISLPGIGSKLAARIVNFREKLGGFYSIEQIRETYGLPDSTYQKIKPYLRSAHPVKRINLNSATMDDLKTHPYIRYNIANAIVAYRNQHGEFSNVADLKKIMLITDEVFQKIEPYLTLNL